jgi:hypothetical protein
VEGEDADGQAGLGRGAGGSGRGRGNRFRGGREDWGMRNQDVSTRDFVYICVSVVLVVLKVWCVMTSSNW